MSFACFVFTLMFGAIGYGEYCNHKYFNAICMLVFSLIFFIGGVVLLLDALGSKQKEKDIMCNDIYDVSDMD